MRGRSRRSYGEESGVNKNKSETMAHLVGSRFLSKWLKQPVSQMPLNDVFALFEVFSAKYKRPRPRTLKEVLVSKRKKSCKK